MKLGAKARLDKNQISIKGYAAMSIILWCARRRLFAIGTCRDTLQQGTIPGLLLIAK